MPFDFSGRRVVVAGGSRGIGRAIAIGFAAAGAHVSICARGAQALERTRADLAAAGAAGRVAHAAPCDLADGAAIARYVGDAAKALGGIDVLVNNASGFGMADDEAGWAAGLAVDVMAMVRASHAALPWLEASAAASGGIDGAAGARGGASILHISSISAYRASARAPAYAAVKAAINSYAGSQAATLAKKGIRVNAIAPGSIEFEGGVWAQRREAGDPVYERTLKGIPFGRMGHPEEVADVALFLASPHARWMTGQVLSVDGGQLLGG